MNKNNLTLKWEELGGMKPFLADDEGCPIIVSFQSQESTVLHTHEFYEFVYVRQGFCLHFVDEKGSLLMPGDFLVIPPGINHSYRCKNDISIVNILFLREAFGGDFGELFSLLNLHSMLHASFSLADREKAKSLLCELTDERERKPLGWKLRSKALLIELIVFTSRIFSLRLPKRQYGNPYMGNILSVMKTIETQCASGISVKDMAASLGLSHGHFTRQFKQITGFAPSEYVQRCRYARALELLHTDRPVGEVAHAAGFGQVNYFSREFKKLFNMTPSQFKKQCRDF